MITDIFARRYQGVLNFDRQWAENIIGPTLVQAHIIFFEDLHPKFRFGEDFFREINEKLARELALPSLKQIPSAAISEQQTCSFFLGRPFQFADEWIGGPDNYCKTRLSMLELLFREAEVRARELATVFAIGNQPNPFWQNTLSSAVQELNTRLRANQTELVYNNGFLHLATDEQSTERIAKPFWEIVADPKWAVVDQEMKGAFDRLDHGQNDAFTYATKALESTIRIISDEKGWSTGNERGAANYIDNLVSARNGRFIEVWEADALKAIFTNVRNPHSHGGGSNPPPRLLDAQQTWVIENCMTWIKSLVRR
jgi:AbiJ N-terminal domain 4